MGTRADFYVGRGPQAEWLGSIALDGYPSGVAHERYPAGQRLLRSLTEAEFRENLSAFFAEKFGQVTKPEQGWPWPWEDSRLTDYAYAFDGGKVWASSFGREWFDPRQPEPDQEGQSKNAVFPDMKARQRVTLGERSGLIISAG